MKDSIDFGSMEIPKLFRKLLIPTVLGMVFSAVFVITDGIFVGRGIGSDALAAINITAPLFLISTGVGLMFGVGASVVASIHLAQGKVKAARINFGSMIRKPTTYRESVTSHPGSRRRTITETSGSEVSTGDCTNTTGMVLRLFTTTPNSPFLMPSTPLRSAHCSRIVPGCFGSERSAAA